MVSGLALVGNIEKLPPPPLVSSLRFLCSWWSGGRKNQLSVPISCQSKGTREMTKWHLPTQQKSASSHLARWEGLLKAGLPLQHRGLLEFRMSLPLLVDGSQPQLTIAETRTQCDSLATAFVNRSDLEHRWCHLEVAGDQIHTHHHHPQALDLGWQFRPGLGSRA